MYNKKIFKRVFNYPKRYWYKNIQMIPRYFKSMHRLIKYGYDPMATWETYCWFIETMRSILNEYSANRNSYPILDLNIETEKNAEIWDNIINRMQILLDDMDEDNPIYDTMDWKESDKKRLAAKDEFFHLFSKYFYHLWD